MKSNAENMDSDMSRHSIVKTASALIGKIRRYELKAPRNITFGAGRLDDLRELISDEIESPRVLLVTGSGFIKRSGLLDRVRSLIPGNIIHYDGVNQEPTVQMVDEGTRVAREEQPNIVVSVGGGSVIDLGKALAALAVNEGSVEDYLEGVGRGFQVKKQPLPHIAVPTVAGTGAEMTKNAVIVSHEKGFKKSMRADSMIPTVALVDPALTITVPPNVTAAGGMDAITQLIEPCITVKRRPETTDLAHESLKLARDALAASYDRPDDLPAREIMALVSSVSGVCLANAGLAMAHGIAAALGALFNVHHGLACGLLLPHTLKYNREACPDELAGALAAFLQQDQPTAGTIEQGISAIEELNRKLNIPPDLKYLNLKNDDIRRLAENSAGTSMAGNPVPMTPGTIRAFLHTLC